MSFSKAKKKYNSFMLNDSVRSIKVEKMLPAHLIKESIKEVNRSSEMFKIENSFYIMPWFNSRQYYILSIFRILQNVNKTAKALSKSMSSISKDMYDIQMLNDQQNHTYSKVNFILYIHKFKFYRLKKVSINY